jgi:hypothetical protein
LEQVHVTGFLRRGLRLPLFAAFSIALAVPAPAMASADAPRQVTRTALSVETRDLNGRTQATLAVTVIGDDALPATGIVAIADNGKPLAGAALNAKGQAVLDLSLQEGDHSLTAAYMGDAAHLNSISEASPATASAGATPTFTVTVAPISLSLTPGQSGTVTASVTPANTSALNAPMFVTLSCSGLPDESSCSFTPENIEILPGATAAISIPVVIATQQGNASLPAHARSTSVAWAFLLPGAVFLGGLAWSARRRPWLHRLSLLAILGLVAILGTAGCNPHYYYYNHGPPLPPATPAGDYTITVTAQSSNGVTAITSNAKFALTVQ